MQTALIAMGLVLTLTVSYVFRKQINDFISSFYAEAKPLPDPKPEPAPVPKPDPVPEPAPVPPPAEDLDAPFLEITSPQTGRQVDPTKPLLVTGKASDKQGMYKVEARFVEPLPSTKGTLWKIATPKAAGDWSDWSVTLIPEGSQYTRVAVKAVDKATNETFKSVTISYGGPVLIPGSSVPYPGATVKYTQNPVYPATIKSAPNTIRQAMIDSGYYSLIQNKVDTAVMKEATMLAFFIDPVKWLDTHPWVYTSYPTYFKEVA